MSSILPPGWDPATAARNLGQHPANPFTTARWANHVRRPNRAIAATKHCDTTSDTVSMSTFKLSAYPRFPPEGKQQFEHERKEFFRLLRLDLFPVLNRWLNVEESSKVVTCEEILDQVPSHAIRYMVQRVMTFWRHNKFHIPTFYLRQKSVHSSYFVWRAPYSACMQADLISGIFNQDESRVVRSLCYERQKERHGSSRVPNLVTEARTLIDDTLFRDTCFDLSDTHELVVRMRENGNLLREDNDIVYRYRDSIKSPFFSNRIWWLDYFCRVVHQNLLEGPEDAAIPIRQFIPNLARGLKDVVDGDHHSFPIDFMFGETDPILPVSFGRENVDVMGICARDTSEDSMFVTESRFTMAAAQLFKQSTRSRIYGLSIHGDGKFCVWLYNRSGVRRSPTYALIQRFVKFINVLATFLCSPKHMIGLEQDFGSCKKAPKSWEDGYQIRTRSRIVPRLHVYESLNSFPIRSSRQTEVYKGVFVSKDKLINAAQFYTVKDYWVPTGTITEAHILRRITRNARILGFSLDYVQPYVHHETVGKMNLIDDLSSPLKLDGSGISQHVEAYGRVFKRQSSRLITDDINWIQQSLEKSVNWKQERLILEWEGRPLSWSINPVYMFHNVLMAIYGHRNLLRAGFLHRRVNFGNVLTNHDGSEGFITDLQYAAPLGTPIAKLSMPPTCPFQPLAYYQEMQTLEVRHDLESFFWLLLFISSTINRRERHWWSGHFSTANDVLSRQHKEHISQLNGEDRSRKFRSLMHEQYLPFLETLENLHELLFVTTVREKIHPVWNPKPEEEWYREFIVIMSKGIRSAESQAEAKRIPGLHFLQSRRGTSRCSDVRRTTAPRRAATGHVRRQISRWEKLADTLNETQRDVKTKVTRWKSTAVRRSTSVLGLPVPSDDVVRTDSCRSMSKLKIRERMNRAGSVSWRSVSKTSTRITGSLRRKSSKLVQRSARAVSVLHRRPRSHSESPESNVDISAAEALLTESLGRYGSFDATEKVSVTGIKSVNSQRVTDSSGVSVSALSHGIATISFGTERVDTPRSLNVIVECGEEPGKSEDEDIPNDLTRVSAGEMGAPNNTAAERHPTRASSSRSGSKRPSKCSSKHSSKRSSKASSKPSSVYVGTGTPSTQETRFFDSLETKMRKYVDSGGRITPLQTARPEDFAADRETPLGLVRSQSFSTIQRNIEWETQLQEVLHQWQRTRSTPSESPMMWKIQPHEPTDTSRNSKVAQWLGVSAEEDAEPETRGSESSIFPMADEGAMRESA